MTDRPINPTHPRRASRRLRPLGACWLLALAAGGLPALAAPPAARGTEPSAASSRYQHDQQRCMRLRAPEERANCLKEANAVRADTHPNQVDPDPGRYARNALERCKPLREPDRSDCVARIQGQGSTSGSVAGGGIYRELVTREPAEPVKP
jgi:hypothetical protein